MALLAVTGLDVVVDEILNHLLGVILRQPGIQCSVQDEGALPVVIRPADLSPLAEDEPVQRHGEDERLLLGGLEEPLALIDHHIGELAAGTVAL